MSDLRPNIMKYPRAPEAAADGEKLERPVYGLLDQPFVANARTEVLQTLLKAPEIREAVSLIQGLTNTDLLQKTGRKQFAEICGALNPLMGKIKGRMGDSATELSSVLIDALRANNVLSSYCHMDDNGDFSIDVRGLTPKIISGLRHLVKKFPRVRIFDGLRFEYDGEKQLSTMEVSLQREDRPVIAFAPFHLDPQASKSKNALPRDLIISSLEKAKEDGSWIVLVGDEPHKMNREYLLIPDAQNLIRLGGNHFLLAVNTAINAVLNENKVAQNREKLTVRVVSMPREAGDHDLSTREILADFPMVNLRQLGQQLVIKVDKTNRDMFEDLVAKARS